MLKAGDAVEVNKIWAYAFPNPLKDWFKGYEFTSFDGNVAIIKSTSGLYAGINFRYSVLDVRAAQKEDFSKRIQK